MTRIPLIDGPSSERPHQDPRVRMLLAIRRVNRLLVQARDRRWLAQAVCAELTATLDYYSAWIALRAEEDDPEPVVASSGLDDEARRAIEVGVRDCSLHCINEALEGRGLLVVADTAAECAQCRVASGREGRAGLCDRLAHRGRTFGTLTVSVPSELAADPDAKALFGELVTDVSVTLDRLAAEARVHRLERERLQAAAQMEASEDRFHRAFHSAPVIMTISSLEDGTFYDVNDTFVSQTGFVRETIIGKRGVDVGFAPAASRAVIRERMMTQGFIRAEPLEARRADGSAMWILFSGEVIEVDGVRRLLASGLDITQQRRRELAQQARLRLSEAASSGVSVEDFVTEMLAAAADLAGAPRASLLQIGPGPDSSLVASFGPPPNGALAAAVGPEESELRRRCLRSKEAEQRLVSAGGDPQGLLAVPVVRAARVVCIVLLSRPGLAFEAEVVELVRDLADVTWERLVARRLEAERERLAHAIEQAPDAFMITDASGRAQYVNPAFETITGFSASEVIGGMASVLSELAAAEADTSQLWAGLERGQAWSGRLVRNRRTGETYDEDMVISSVRDDAGQITNLVVIGRDVTEQTSLTQQLLQAQKMEAIGQLTGGVAHDFNNLLQIINAAGELAALDLEPDHPARGSFDEIAAAGARAARLVKQLLIFSRRQVMRFEVLDLVDAVTHVLKLLRRLIGEDIEVDWAPQAGLPEVRADRGMVEQALLNLCVNARDAMSGGGRLGLRVHARSFVQTELTAESWVQPGDFLGLVVEDDGAGMDAQTVEHLFEPFFTTKGPGHGTGLGLASVYGIMKQHGGLVRVDSAPGEGARFVLYWPVHRGAQAVEGGAADATAVPEDKLTILVAEDEPRVRMLTERMLSRAGHRVLQASNGAEAVELLERRTPEIDLVILDAVMPQMGGFEAFQRMRQLRPDLPVLFATGYSEHVLTGDLPVGASVEVLQKPFTRTALLDAVARAVERSDSEA